jgi:hypothetical protein
MTAPATRRSWLNDFEFSADGVHVKKTGVNLKITRSLLNDVFTWFTFHGAVQVWRLSCRLTGRATPSIAFHPDVPRPWYLIWSVLHVAGARIVKDPDKADILFHFDDQTVSENVPPVAGPRTRYVNFNCRDVSKSRVTNAWERVCGYPFAVDPTTYAGQMVEKSELNAAHDGQILKGPLAPVEGKVYQRLIDNEIEGGLVEDLRTCIVGGKPTITFRKRRPVDRRFLNENTSATLARPEECFSRGELALITRFAAEIGLEWGGVDILRDRHTGQIFAVDANKTDMGPPVIMKLGDKLRATRRLARAFVAAFGK